VWEYGSMGDPDRTRRPRRRPRRPRPRVSGSRRTTTRTTRTRIPVRSGSPILHYSHTPILRSEQLALVAEAPRHPLGVEVLGRREGVLARGADEIAELGGGHRLLLRQVSANAGEDLLQRLAVEEDPFGDANDRAVVEQRVPDFLRRAPAQAPLLHQ